MRIPPYQHRCDQLHAHPELTITITHSIDGYFRTPRQTHIPANMLQRRRASQPSNPNATRITQLSASTNGSFSSKFAYFVPTSLTTRTVPSIHVQP